jgi:hypothetical protein
MDNACSALVNGQCLNGFFVMPACDPVRVPWACHACGREFNRQPTPMCMSEALCASTFPENGAPHQRHIDRARRLAGV